MGNLFPNLSFMFMLLLCAYFSFLIQRSIHWCLVYISYEKLTSKGTGSTLRSCNLFTNRRTVSRITVHTRSD